MPPKPKVTKSPSSTRSTAKSVAKPAKSPSARSPSPKPKPKATKKMTKSNSPSKAKKTTRAPTAYNLHIKEAIPRLTKKHPSVHHREIFKMAAAEWTKSKK
jgi:hypothetical protein